MIFNVLYGHCRAKRRMGTQNDEKGALRTSEDLYYVGWHSEDEYHLMRHMRENGKLHYRLIKCLQIFVYFTRDGGVNHCNGGFRFGCTPCY